MLHGVLFFSGLALALLGNISLAGLAFGFPTEEIAISLLLLGGTLWMVAGSLPAPFDEFFPEARVWRTVIAPLWFIGTIGYTLTALTGEASRYFLFLPIMSLGLGLISTGPTAGGGSYPGAYLLQRLLGKER